MIGWKNKEFVQNYISEPQKKMFSKITIKKKKNTGFAVGFI